MEFSIGYAEKKEKRIRDMESPKESSTTWCSQRRYILEEKNVPGGIDMSNLLKNETSPYLLQHAENPVQWYP